MHPTILEIVGTLRAERTAQRLSQRALGELAGLTQAQVSRIEGGGVDPRASSVVELARALGVELMLVPRKVVPAALALGAGPVRAGDGPSADDG